MPNTEHPPDQLALRLQGQPLWKALVSDSGTGLAAVTPLLGWGYYLWELLRGAKGDPTTAFWIAVGLTAIGLPVGLVRARRTLRLLRFGEEVPGTVTAIKPLEKQFSARVDVRYAVQGRDYTKAFSVTFVLGEQLEQQPHVTVIVDPGSPQRCLLKEDILSRKAQPAQ
jgi:hypothetical protein